MIRPGDVIPLTIEKPAAGGRMIARHDGQVILVSAAIPGERVRARIERTGRSVAYAETVAVDEPSSDRRDPPGDPLCGGCTYAHVAYARQVEIKAQVIADAFARIGRLPLPLPVSVAASPEEGYRMRARLHVRGASIGFFREGTHETCDARQTRQLLPATFDVLDRIGAVLRSLAIDGVREIELAENRDAADRVVALEAVPPIGARTMAHIAAIDGLTGVVCDRRVAGQAWVTDSVELPGAPRIGLRRHVRAFFQGNRFLLDALVAHVTGTIPEGGEVVDLYAGGGLLSLAAAAVRHVRVTAVEGDRIAAADLAANAAGAEGVTPVHEPVESFVARALPPSETARTIVVDPPRTGMSKEALDGVIRSRPSRVTYVSCDVATLARDARALSEAGYLIDRVDGFDLFPNTPHVETVVVFVR